MKTRTKQGMANARKEGISSSPTRLGAARWNCANTSRPSRRCAPTLRSTSSTRSSACPAVMSCPEQRRRGSSCASLSLKGWTGPCTPRSNTTSTITPKFTLLRRGLTSTGGCRPTHSTTTRVRPLPGSWRRSSVSARTGRAGMLCPAPRRRASGSSTKGPGGSARRSDFKRSSTQCWMTRSLSPNSDGGWNGGA